MKTMFKIFVVIPLLFVGCSTTDYINSGYTDDIYYSPDDQEVEIEKEYVYVDTNQTNQENSNNEYVYKSGGIAEENQDFENRDYYLSFNYGKKYNLGQKNYFQNLLVIIEVFLQQEVNERFVLSFILLSFLIGTILYGISTFY